MNQESKALTLGEKQSNLPVVKENYGLIESKKVPNELVEVKTGQNLPMVRETNALVKVEHG